MTLFIKLIKDRGSFVNRLVESNFFKDNVLVYLYYILVTLFAKVYPVNGNWVVNAK